MNLLTIPVAIFCFEPGLFTLRTGNLALGLERDTVGAGHSETGGIAADLSAVSSTNEMKLRGVYLARMADLAGARSTLPVPKSAEIPRHNAVSTFENHSTQVFDARVRHWTWDRHSTVHRGCPRCYGLYLSGPERKPGCQEGPEGSEGFRWGSRSRP